MMLTSIFAAPNFNIINMIKALIFDWGDTIMRDDPNNNTPMYIWENVSYIKGTESLLQLIHKDYIMVIATNAGQSDTEAMIKALKRVGADKYFQYFFSSKDIGFEKPDKRFFQTIVNNINLLSNECIMIGNIYEKDIVGSKDIGMKTIFFNEKNIEGNFQKADFIVNCMSEIFDSIKRVNL
jgi:putative hydrolase of the HAD superfamily